MAYQRKVMRELLPLMLRVGTEEERLTVGFGALTGLRAHDQRRLLWSNIDLERRIGRLVLGKTDKFWVMPLASRLCQLLMKWRSKSHSNLDEHKVFSGPHGEAINANRFTIKYLDPLYVRAMEQWPSNAEAPVRPRWSDLRRFAADCWLEATIDERAVGAFLGLKPNPLLVVHLTPPCLESWRPKLDAVGEWLLGTNDVA